MLAGQETKTRAATGKKPLAGTLLERTAFRHTMMLVALAAVGYVAHAMIFSPALFMDDWTSVVERVITGNARWFDPAMRRPLLFTPFLLQHAVFGLNLTAYYAILWLLYIVMAFQLAILVENFAPFKGGVFGLIVGLLFLVYPTNYTHMWLIMLGIYVGSVLTLFYAILWVKFARTGRWPNFLIGLICLIVPLGIYEGQIGLAAAWAGIVVLLVRPPSWKRRLLLLTPVVLLAGFAVWRTFGFQAAGVSDPYLERVTTAPAELVSRLMLGYKVTLAWGWTTALAALHPLLARTTAAAAALAGVTGFLLIAGRFLLPNRSTAGRKTGGKRPELRATAAAAGVGLILVGAGYVPIFTVFLPSLSGIGSRFNLFASIGGALFVTAVVKVAATLLGKTDAHRRSILVLGILPLLLVGVLSHLLVQRYNRQAWREQTDIWQQLFISAPDLADDTLVLFVLPGFEDRSGFINMRRTPLSASWEASSGIRLLYDNFTLAGDVIFPDIDEPIEPELTAAGVLSNETGDVTPYERIVAFERRPDTGELVSLETLPALLLDGDESVQLCRTCILTGPPPEAPLRRLVEK